MQNPTGRFSVPACRSGVAGQAEGAHTNVNTSPCAWRWWWEIVRAAATTGRGVMRKVLDRPLPRGKHEVHTRT